MELEMKHQRGYPEKNPEWFCWTLKPMYITENATAGLSGDTLYESESEKSIQPSLAI